MNDLYTAALQLNKLIDSLVENNIVFNKVMLGTQLLVWLLENLLIF